MALGKYVYNNNIKTWVLTKDDLLLQLLEEADMSSMSKRHLFLFFKSHMRKRDYLLYFTSKRFYANLQTRTLEELTSQRL